jgi:hypothetical protein
MHNSAKETGPDEAVESPKGSGCRGFCHQRKYPNTKQTRKKEKEMTIFRWNVRNCDLNSFPGFVPATDRFRTFFDGKR